MFLPQPNSEDIQRGSFAMGSPLQPVKARSFQANRNSVRTICKSSKERESDHGPGKEVEWRTKDFILK
jgi:hypothetical protein